MREVVNALRRLVPRRAASGGTDFHDVAKRVRRVPEAEMAAAEAALADGGVLAGRLIRQLREAGHVWRSIGNEGDYELRISTVDALVIRDVPPDGWTSRWIPVVTDDARVLELRILVIDAGVVELLGRTRDGQRWPPRWRAPPEELERIRASGPWLDLPAPSALRAARTAAAQTIATWLGDADTLRGRRGIVRAGPPASEDALEALAAREHFVLPADYQSLLLAADGVEVGPIVVLGTRDAYRLDMPGPARLVIAPPDEDGALTLDESGAVVHVAVEEATTHGTQVAPDLRTWLRRRLSRLRRSREGS